MYLAIECYARGERGTVHHRTVPWMRLVGPNTGLLEALFQDRTGTRPLDVGDIVRIPDVGRFVVLPNGWASVPTGWVTPLDRTGQPLDAESWPLDGTLVIHPDDPVDRPSIAPRALRSPRQPRIGRTVRTPPPPGPLTAASRRLKAKGR